MKTPTIIALRGTGVLMRTISIDNHHLTTLRKLAKAYDEELSIAWFDPAFRWLDDVRTIFNSVADVSEYRGLVVDNRSFLEIRQPPKQRKQVTMDTLLRTDQLFPLVKRSAFCVSPMADDKNVILEITHGIGCLGRFETDTFDLADLELAIYKLPLQNKEVALLTSHAGLAMHCENDDFVVRRNELDLTLIR